MQQVRSKNWRYLQILSRMSKDDKIKFVSVSWLCLREMVPFDLKTNTKKGTLLVFSPGFVDTCAKILVTSTTSASSNYFYSICQTS